MKRTIFLVCIGCLIISTGCKEGKKQQVRAKENNEKLFRLPDIPANLTRPNERAGYLAVHYWDSFNFADSSVIKQPDKMEPLFADFIGILPHANYTDACKGIKKLMSRVAENSSLLASVLGLADKYLYDVNSPMRNEEFYIPFLESVVDSKTMDEPHKIRFRYQLTMALKNRPDSIAKDFTYTLASGMKSSLSKIVSEYTLLFFNNPDCGICGEFREKIIASSVITSMQHSSKNGMKRLTVLSIYTEDDLKFWRKQLWKNPSGWICGYDEKNEIRNHGLYDLKKIPTLYLLNKDKRVVLKDASPEIVEEYFSKKSDS